MTTYPKLVVEWRYTDGDVGAYNAGDISPREIEALRLLWTAFATPRPGHEPASVVIRPQTAEEQEA